MEASRAQEVNAKIERERLAGLSQGGAATQREFDAAQRAQDVAAAQLREAEERLKLVREGPRKEQIEQGRAALAEANARVDQAAAALSLAETRLAYATIVSPLTGVVLSKNIEEGEYVAPGTPVITVADLVNVWLRAYVSETDLCRVKLGQSVRRDDRHLSRQDLRGTALLHSLRGRIHPQERADPEGAGEAGLSRQD